MDDSVAPPASFRHANLKKSFKLGIRSILTAISKEDVWKAFPTFTDVEKQSLYRMFVQVIKSLHENIEEEFESICQEAKVGITLDTVERLVEEQKLDILSRDKTDIGDIREKISKAKKDEIQYLVIMLQKVEYENNMMITHIEPLKEKHDFSDITVVAEKLRNWNAEYEMAHGT